MSRSFSGRSPSNAVVGRRPNWSAFRRSFVLLAAAAGLLAGGRLVHAQDVSAPVILQWFEGTYSTIERRTPDIFSAGYGGVWTPPPGRADSGNQSVGYDQYNRFDLGSPGAPTLYGTETGLRTLVNSIQRTGASIYVDLVWNHNGFRDISSTGFNDGGGYPGFTLSARGTSDGDFHSAFASGDLNGRLSGLIDIAHETNNQYIRNPVTPGDSRNIPGGQYANFPTEANRRFYQNRSGPPSRYLFDPTTGETNIPVWDFDATSATSGTPVTENAVGYLMRNAQWLVQTIGVDGFRLDATKNYPAWVENYFDRAVYRTSRQTLLNGQQKQIFSFGEYFDGNPAAIQTTIRKDINPNDPGRIGGNRDALDFPLYFAMQSNLSSNGLQNDWRNVTNASLDRNDDGLANNGSQGVAFVLSHDSGGPALSNVAFAYTLLRPGNAVVYFNGKEFGNGRDFPKDGRGDALGGQYGTTITRLVDIRNEYGRGNYIIRPVRSGDPTFVNDRAKDTLVIERENSVLAAYSNRGDSYYAPITVLTAFAPGTPLVELSGNANDPAVNPGNQLARVAVVNADGTVNLTVPANYAPGGVYTGKGYVIYGPSGPQGTLSVSNIAQTLGAETPTANTNGTARLTAVPVIRANTFTLSLQTQQVTLLGSIRDINADGDNAIFSVDGGTNITGGPFVSTTPGSVSYGFQSFSNASPLIGGGTGLYSQPINTTTLSEGYHYIEVRAFRRRNAGEPAIYNSWRQSIYVDRLPPVSAIQSFAPTVSGTNENRTVTVRSVDLTANSVHVLLDLVPGLTDAQILARIGSSTQATRTDRDLWNFNLSGLTSGNHVLTVVSYEETGTYNIQRFPGQLVSGIFGLGLGDVNFDGQLTTSDITQFASLIYSSTPVFNPAADINGDGVLNFVDGVALSNVLYQLNASQAVWTQYRGSVLGIVPEPTGLAVLAVAWLLPGRRTRRRTFGRVEAPTAAGAVLDTVCNRTTGGQNT